MRLDQITKRLREAGSLPRFAAPSGTEPPPELKSPPQVTRQVGRRIVQAGRGVRT
jgi:hypothetical protein